MPERPRSAASSKPGTPPPAKQESIEAFEDRTLGAAFRLTLKEDAQRDIFGQRIFLSGLQSELQDEGKELRIQTATLDQALLEAASKAEKQRPLDYLLPCWKRITKLHKGFRRTRDDDPKFQVLCEARRLCMSYCIFAITMPEMFGYVYQGLVLEPLTDVPVALTLLSGLHWGLTSCWIRKMRRE